MHHRERPCFTKLSPPGPPKFASGDDHTGVLNQWRFETSVDLQAISALCPNCKIVLSEASSYFSQDLANAQVRVASGTPTPDVISDSFGAPLQNMNGDAYFGSKGWWTFPSVATVVASGDAGYPAERTLAMSLPPVTRCAP